MDMSGQERIEAPVEAVWRALNDPEVLKRCIPGCERLEKQSDTEMTATVVLRVGPVKATFEGAVELGNLNPPHSYTISGEGKGGIAGFAKGGAVVRLEPTEAGGTSLHYEAEAQIGGKLAQIGQRLVAGTAKKLADEFFANFAKAAGEEGAVAAA